MANDDRSNKGGEASAEPGHGAVSASEVEKYVKGTNFPVDKNGLVEQARSNNAPQEVLDLMENFPERDYASAADVASAISEAKK